ncbi:MAG TPA: ATP-binding protein [Gaiellaceae bacterium]
MISRLPIRIRLMLPFAVGMAVVLAATGFVIYHRVAATLLSSVDQALRGQADEATNHLANGRTLLDRDAPSSASVGQLVAGNGHVLESTPKGLPPLVSGGALRSVLRGGRSLDTRAIRGLGDHWRILAVPAPSGRAAIVVAASLESRDEALDRLLRELLLGGPIALAVATLAGYLLAAGALRPVEAMRRRAASIGASTPGARLPEPRSRDELFRLAETLNEMLARLESAVEHERRFVDDASHELRTPLALLRTELELALRRPRSHEELVRALGSAAEEADRLGRLSEDLLLFARYDQGWLPLQLGPVEANTLLEGATARFDARARRAGRQLRIEHAPGIVLEGDQARLEQAIDNLVENALAHGAGAVSLFTAQENGRVELHVTDEGTGVPAPFLPRAFDRFSRADEARGAGGTGLGLAIVDLVARAHGGEAHLANRPEGGVDAWISVDAAHSDT